MTDEMSALTRVNHVAIWVADIESSVKWYTSSFSCEVVTQNLTHAVLRFENITVKLFLPSQQPPHLGYEKSDAASFGEIFKESDGVEQTFISDPTGNPVALVLPPKQ